MDPPHPPAPAAPSEPSTPYTCRPGDLAVSKTGYPILFEVIAVLEDGLVRVRGLNWAAGYSALMHADEIRSTSSLRRR